MLCVRVHDQIYAYAQKRNVTVNFHSSVLFNNNLVSDKHRLGQILKNFISNAIKNSPHGGKVDVYINIDEENRTVKFNVKDYGTGISRKDQLKLFRPFSQVKEKTCCSSWLSGCLP